MELQTVILSMLMSLPPAYADRNEEGREQRLETIAQAVRQAAERASCDGWYYQEDCDPIWHGEAKQLAAMLVAKGWWESRFLKNVHEGKCLPHECDAIRIKGAVVHRARSPWQFQRTSFSNDLWESSVGTSLEATRNAAYVAARVLSSGMNKCHSIPGALSYYANQRCNWQAAGLRFKTFKKLMVLPLT